MVENLLTLCNTHYNSACIVTRILNLRHSPAIYDGPLDVCEKHNTLHRFTRSWLVFKDPFTHEPSSATQASTSRISSSFRASTGRTAQRPHCKYISFRTCGLFFFSNSNFQASNPPSQPLRRVNYAH